MYSFKKPVLDSLLFSIALAVGLTPQLLPAIINVNLSKGSQEMAKHGVIVRRLESIENFGSMDILCTDKTGTLTQGVVQSGRCLGCNGRTSDAVKRLAYLERTFQTGLPNPLDEAIVKPESRARRMSTKVDEIPYDFIRKRLTVVVRKKAIIHYDHERCVGKCAGSLHGVEGEGMKMPRTGQQAMNTRCTRHGAPRATGCWGGGSSRWRHIPFPKR